MKKRKIERRGGEENSLTSMMISLKAILSDVSDKGETLITLPW